MDFINLLPAGDRDELREWLMENHDKENECWVVVRRGRPTDDETFWYIDAVEEALCFGWIDGTTKKMENGVMAQRLAPRRKRSLWSELNKERCRRGYTGPIRLPSNGAQTNPRGAAVPRGFCFSFRRVNFAARSCFTTPAPETRPTAAEC